MDRLDINVSTYVRRFEHRREQRRARESSARPTAQATTHRGATKHRLSSTDGRCGACIGFGAVDACAVIAPDTSTLPIVG